VASHFGGCSPTSLPRLPPSRLLASRFLVCRSTFHTASTPFHSPSAFTTCTSSRPFLPGGATFFRFSAPPAPRLSLAFFRTCILVLPVISVAVLPSISFFGLCLCVYDLRYFRPCPHIVLYQSMQVRHFLIPNRAGIHLVNEFCTHTGMMDGVPPCAWRESQGQRNGQEWMHIPNSGRAVRSQPPLLNTYAGSGSLSFKINLV
jgi:hypothetical protein